MDVSKVSAATRVVGVMGDPVTHSLSPRIHNAAFNHLEMDWICVGFHTPEGQSSEALRGVKALGIAGMSVTMPHKAAVISELDEISDDASTLNAVNCIVASGARLRGLNTDGDGFVAGLEHDFGITPTDKRCAVLGAGGAARSVILALGRAGAESITVINRTASSGATAAAIVEQASVGDQTAIASCELVVNATSVGMGDSDEVPCDPGLLGPHQFVVDLIYSPAQTRWLKLAAQQGAATANGLSMLVHQAAVAFEAWTGEKAPVSIMMNAVKENLVT